MQELSLLLLHKNLHQRKSNADMGTAEKESDRPSASRQTDSHLAVAEYSI